MAKIIILCTLANCSTECNGIKFAPSEDPTTPGMLSEPVDEEAVQSLLTIPGFSVYEQKAKRSTATNQEREALLDEAHQLGLDPHGNIGINKLREMVETRKAELAKNPPADDTQPGGEGTDTLAGSAGEDTAHGGEGAGAGIF